MQLFLKLGVLVGIAALLSSCAVGIQGAAASVSPLRSNQYSVIKPQVTATQCSLIVLGFGDFVRVDSTVGKMTAENGGDAAINVRWAEESNVVTWLIQVLSVGLISQRCVQVTADIVKFQ